MCPTLEVVAPDAVSTAEQTIEEALCRAIARATAPPCPPLLAEALRYAVFPPGSRMRPRLCLAVAQACGDKGSELAIASAVAIELYHCASLVLDDLPCFDGAETRRGRPALHSVVGDATTILVGSGLIVLAAESVARIRSPFADRHTAVQRRLLRSVGTRYGLVAGQAWEAEPHIDTTHYHACKTASLFEAATSCGALASGDTNPAWALVGQRLGTAYQIADDIADVYGEASTLGKPVAQDGAGRPNVALELGCDGARRELRCLLAAAIRDVPACSGLRMLRRWLAEASRGVLARATTPVQSAHAAPRRTVPGNKTSPRG